MMDREKRMLKVLGPLIGLGVLYGLFNYVILPPFRNVRQELSQAIDRKSELEQKIRARQRYLIDYRELYHSVAAQPEEFSIKKTDPEWMRDDIAEKINDLLQRCHLNDQNKTVIHAPTHIVGQGRGAKKQLDLMMFKYNVSGDTNNLLQFILQSYQSGDLFYLSDVSMKPDAQQRGRLVKADLTLQAAVVPRNQGWIKEADQLSSQPSSVPAQEPTKLAYADVAEYNKLIEWKPFDLYVPPPPPPTRVVENPVENPPVRIEPPQPVGDPDRTQLVVRGFVGDEVLLVRQDGAPISSRQRRNSQADNASIARQYRKIGEEFDGGSLVLVHRLGAIARKKEMNTPDSPEKLFLYPYGKLMSECMPLADAHSQGYREVQLAVRDAGLDVVPGTEPDAADRE